MNYYCKLCDQNIENLFIHLRDIHQLSVEDYLEQMRNNFVPVVIRKEESEPDKENHEPTFNFHK